MVTDIHEPHTVDALFGRSASLPAVPAVLSRLLAEIDESGQHSSRVAALIAGDPVLAARTLRLANSSHFHRSHRIDSIAQAVQLLGITMIRTMALAVSLQDAFPARRGFDLKAFWVHSVRTACTARWLARHGRVDPDQAAVVGLLHGIGLLQMHAGMARALEPLDARCAPLHAHRAAAEREAFGFDHAAVAARMAREWRFPTRLADALETVPRPDPQAASFPLALLVAAAARISRGGSTDLGLHRSPATGWRGSRASDGGGVELQTAGGVWTLLPGFDTLCAGFEALLA